MSYFDRQPRRHSRYSDDLSPPYGTYEDDYTPPSSVTSSDKRPYERPIRRSRSYIQRQPVIVRRYSRGNSIKSTRRPTSTASLGLSVENVALRAQLRYEKLKAEAAACTDAEKAYIELGKKVQAADPAASSRIDQGRELAQARQAWLKAGRRAGMLTGSYEH